MQTSEKHDFRINIVGDNVELRPLQVFAVLLHLRSLQCIAFECQSSALHLAICIISCRTFIAFFTLPPLCRFLAHFVYKLYVALSILYAVTYIYISILIQTFL
jgi:hypothetical protein